MEVNGEVGTEGGTAAVKCNAYQYLESEKSGIRKSAILDFDEDGYGKCKFFSWSVHRTNRICFRTILDCTNK